MMADAHYPGWEPPLHHPVHRPPERDYNWPPPGGPIPDNIDPNEPPEDPIIARQGQPQGPRDAMQKVEITPADTIRLTRLKNKMSQAQEAVDNGTLSPPEGQQMMAKLQAGIMPIQQRMQIAQAQQKQEAEKAMQEQVAHMEVLQQQNAEFRAQNLEKRIAVIENPKTGEKAHMYEGKPDHWERVEWPLEEKAHDASLKNLGTLHQHLHERAMKKEDMAHQHSIEAANRDHEMSKLAMEQEHAKEIEAMQPAPAEGGE